MSFVEVIKATLRYDQSTQNIDLYHTVSHNWILGFSSPIWTTMSWPFCSCTAHLTCFIWKIPWLRSLEQLLPQTNQLNDRLGQSAHFFDEQSRFTINQAFDKTNIVIKPLEGQNQNRPIIRITAYCRILIELL